LFAAIPRDKHWLSVEHRLDVAAIAILALIVLVTRIVIDFNRPGRGLFRVINPE
jgi:hypothetical protein